MRFQPLAFLLPSLFLSSCAYEGVIVRKDSAPLPFYESVGVDGSYKLALRDSTGAVHSQLVTPEVFEGHAEGDYFNDLQPAPNTASAAAKGMAAAGSNAGTRALALGRGNLREMEKATQRKPTGACIARSRACSRVPAVHHALASAQRVTDASSSDRIESAKPGRDRSFLRRDECAGAAPAPAPQTASTAYVVAAKSPVAATPHAHVATAHRSRVESARDGRFQGEASGSVALGARAQERANSARSLGENPRAAALPVPPGFVC